MKETKENGITLIALIVTVIILLILAGVSISMVSGDGLFSKARSASETYKAAANNETKLLEEYENFMQEYTTGGSTTPSTPPAPTYTITYNANGGSGEMAATTGENPQVVANTYTAPSGKAFKEWNTAQDGTGTTVTVGTVISANTTLYAIWAKKDTNNVFEGEEGYTGESYDSPYIPVGFIHTEGTWNNGYTIKGKAGTTNANDEFVWVPCVLDATSFPSVNNNTNTIKTGDSVTTFGKTTTGKYNSNSFGLLPTDTTVVAEDSTVSAIETSVGNYGGFYIAKYEAGIAGETDNYSLETQTATDGSVKPLSQAGKGVWNKITRTDAITVSKAMVSTTDGVHSTLISGAAWDTTLKWMVNTSDNHSANAGYDTNSEGKGWYTDNSGNEIHVTGISVATANANRVNNIWDMAGNVNEWTTENCKSYDSDKVVIRGGCYSYTGSSFPAASRLSWTDTTYRSISFRPVLYK